MMISPETTTTSPNSPARAWRRLGSDGNNSIDTDRCLQILGVSKKAGWDEIHFAHARLVSDLTPGVSATHGNVKRALTMLDEVNQAYALLCENIAA